MARARMTDAGRRRLRRILMIALAPVAIVGLLLAGKLVSVNAFADAAQNAYERRAYQEAEVQARGAMWPVNGIEPWKGPYNVGVALGMRGELEDARAQLEEALSLNGEEGSNEYCIILTSIVYVVEKQGDVARDADDSQTANGLYDEALGIIDAAPEGCFAEPTSIQADTGEQLEQSVPRIEEKIEQQDGGGEGESEEEESEGGESEESEGEAEGQTQQEQLEQQNQDAQEQQQQQDEYNQQQGEESGGGGVEQPW